MNQRLKITVVIQSIAFCLVILLISFNSAQSQTLPTNDTLRFEWVERCEQSEVNCQIKIDAIGLFSKNSGQDFAQFIEQIPTRSSRPIIHFSSRGGNLAGALRVGQLIREHEFITQTGFKESVCYSACTYAFMGGSIRELGPQAKFGLHQFYSIDNDLSASSSQSISAVLSRYLDLMGVDKKTLQLALATKPNAVTLVSKAQAQQLLIDNSQQPFQPWRIETTETGQLILVTTERQANRPWSTTLVITKTQGQYRLLVQYIQHDKKNDVAAFANINPSLNLMLNNAAHKLVTITPWHSPKAGVIQRWHLLNTSLVQQLSQMNSNEFTLLIDFSEEILKQQNMKSETHFGKNHLAKNLLALSKN